MAQRHRDQHRDPKGRFLRAPKARVYYDPQDVPLASLCEQLQSPFDPIQLPSDVPVDMAHAPYRVK